MLLSFHVTQINEFKSFLFAYYFTTGRIRCIRCTNIYVKVESELPLYIGIRRYPIKSRHVIS